MMKILFFVIMLNLTMTMLNNKFLLFILMNLIFILSIMYFLTLNLNFYWMNMYSWMGIDKYSMVMILLTIWIMALMFLSSNNFKNLNFYSFINLILLLILLMTFMSMNYFMFYLFFEMSLIPTFILIIGWGYQPERIKASMYMLFYTTFASLPLLILMYLMFNYFNSMNYMILLNNMMLIKINKIILFTYMILAFLIKLPLFFFHLWLPKAHIEAPITGSMILAAIMLKLGGYGIMRSMMMMMNLSWKYNFLLSGISLFGMIYLSIMTIRYNDFKLIVANSSIIHMMFMLLGIMSMTTLGFLGSMIMMVGHGLCSSALFLLISFNYNYLKSRNSIINKGLMFFFPSMSMWWFMFCIINMAAPISLNLMSEILILMSLTCWSNYIKFLLMICMFLSSIYSLYLFSYSQHGKNFNNIVKINTNKMIEFMLMILHWIPLNFMIFKIQYFF